MKKLSMLKKEGCIFIRDGQDVVAKIDPIYVQYAALFANSARMMETLEEIKKAGSDSSIGMADIVGWAGATLKKVSEDIYGK